MARRGRTRKFKRRERSGKILRLHRAVASAERTAEILSVVAAQPHRARYGEQFRDQRAESELGRLAMDGVLTAQQYEAGIAYRRVVASMRREICAPPTHAKSHSGLMLKQGGQASLAQQITDEAEEEKFWRALGKHSDAVRSMSADQKRAVDGVVLDERSIYDSISVFDLKGGLNVLADHFGLIARKRA